jgi:hypothetical protein
MAPLVPVAYRNSEVLTKLSQIPSSVEYTFVTMGFIHLQIEWNPWLGRYRPQIPVLSALYPRLNLLNPRKKIPGYAIAWHWTAFNQQASINPAIAHTAETGCNCKCANTRAFPTLHHTCSSHMLLSCNTGTTWFERCHGHVPNLDKRGTRTSRYAALCNIIPSITRTHLFSDFLQHSKGNNTMFTTELPVV